MTSKVHTQKPVGFSLKVGDEYPVYWDTGDGRPAGSHMARILDIKPYTGQFPEHFTVFLKLYAPTTKRGFMEMAA